MAGYEPSEAEGSEPREGFPPSPRTALGSVHPTQTDLSCHSSAATYSPLG